MATKKAASKTANAASNKAAEGAEEKSVRAVVVDSTRFETQLYGEIGVVLLAFPDEHGFARDGVFVVSVKEPYGMAMTEWRRRMLGCHQVRFPLTVH
jgi:hypothetical protein